MTISRSADRIKQTGEIFTPLKLVDEILDKLPSDLFTDFRKTFLDPACGDGNFLVRVLQRKIDNGSTPTQALETTYGVDIMKDNITRCRQRLIDIAGDSKQHWKIVNHNIVWASALPIQTPNDDPNWSNREWDFDKWQYKESQEDKVNELLEF